MTTDPDRPDYDSLSVAEQAAGRAGWAERMDARREALDLAAEFQAEGTSYVGVDERGRLVWSVPDGAVHKIEDPHVQR